MSDENTNPNIQLTEKTPVLKVRKSKVPKPGDIIVVPVEMLEVSPTKAKQMLGKKPRSEKQKINDQKLREKQKDKKIGSDSKKELIKAAEQKLLDDTKNVKIKVMPKRVRKKKIIDFTILPIDNTTENTESKKEQSESSDDEEIKTLKRHVKKVSIKKELYDQLNNIKLQVKDSCIKNDTMRSKTPNKYEGLMNAMFR